MGWDERRRRRERRGDGDGGCDLRTGRGRLEVSMFATWSPTVKRTAVIALDRNRKKQKRKKGAEIGKR
jgi:hypothetical protein